LFIVCHALEKGIYGWEILLNFIKNCSLHTNHTE
jgi:hypothetical protein